MPALIINSQTLSRGSRISPSEMWFGYNNLQVKDLRRIMRERILGCAPVVSVVGKLLFFCSVTASRS